MFGDRQTNSALPATTPIFKNVQPKGPDTTSGFAGRGRGAPPAQPARDATQSGPQASNNVWNDSEHVKNQIRKRAEEAQGMSSNPTQQETSFINPRTGKRNTIKKDPSTTGSGNVVDDMNLQDIHGRKSSFVSRMTEEERKKEWEDAMADARLNPLGDNPLEDPDDMASFGYAAHPWRGGTTTGTKFQSEIDSLKRTINELVLRSQYGVSANPVNSSLHTSLQGQFHDFF
jgi:hypothetical protein